MDSVERLLLVFHVEDQRYALRLAAVSRVLPMMEIAPLPEAPGAVVGVINVSGVVVPVLDLRRRFGLRLRESLVSDVLILARARAKAVALPADGVVGLIERAREEITPADRVAAGLRHVDGVVKLDDGLALIHDVDRFLLSSEQAQLSRALDVQEERS